MNAQLWDAARATRIAELERLVQKWRRDAVRQRVRAETWRHRALRKRA